MASGGSGTAAGAQATDEQISVQVRTLSTGSHDVRVSPTVSAGYGPKNGGRTEALPPPCCLFAVPRLLRRVVQQAGEWLGGWELGFDIQHCLVHRFSLPLLT